MNSKRQAKKILKAYAKEIVDARVQYADSFNEKQVSVMRRISYRHMMKRCVLVVLILVLTMAILVVGANALGLKIFNFSFLEKSDHAELVNHNKERHKVYFEPTYIPDGYTFVMQDDFFEESRDYVYVDKDEVYLYITESFGHGFSSSINNENCTRSTIAVDEIEVKVFEYDDGGYIYLLQKKETLIIIQGILKKNEAVKIIQGLKEIP